VADQNLLAITLDNFILISIYFAVSSTSHMIFLKLARPQTNLPVNKNWWRQSMRVFRSRKTLRLDTGCQKVSHSFRNSDELLAKLKIRVEETQKF